LNASRNAQYIRLTYHLFVHKTPYQTHWAAKHAPLQPEILLFPNITHVRITAYLAPDPLFPQNSQTYQNRNPTAAKNPSQTFHPTPVFCAILSIRFIVPLIFSLEPSNWSFIFSAREVESRISSPMAIVNYTLLSAPHPNPHPQILSLSPLPNLSPHNSHRVH
jgi:hypothetical protein